MVEQYWEAPANTKKTVPTKMDNQPQSYIDSLTSHRRERILTLQQMILEVAPEAVIDMHYKMPTYHVGDQWVAMASQKFYISLYTCERENIQNFRNAYPAIRTGQGCINFRDKDELPEIATKKVLQRSLQTGGRE